MNYIEIEKITIKDKQRGKDLISSFNRLPVRHNPQTTNHPPVVTWWQINFLIHNINTIKIELQKQKI